MYIYQHISIFDKHVTIKWSQSQLTQNNKFIDQMCPTHGVGCMQPLDYILAARAA